jgi:hypothetical protein
MKRPRSNLFENKHMPWLSCQRIFKITFAAPEHENMAAERITSQHLLDLQR